MENPLTGKMRAAVLMRPGEIRIEMRDVPTPGEGQVLVNVKALGICGSDLRYFREGRIGDCVVTRPLILGHEAAGIVTASGKGADGLQAGQPVSIEPGWPCRRCDYCKRGRYNLCRQLKFLATPPDDGAFCDYLVMPADFAHPIPAGMSLAEAAMIEPLSVGVHACRQGELQAGETVLISGGGPIGLCCLMAAICMGARKVFVIEPQGFRRNKALELGAAAAFDPTDQNCASDLRHALEGGADLILEASGALTAIEQTIDCVRPGGRIVLVGFPREERVPLNLNRLMAREAQLRTAWRYVNDFPLAIRFAAACLTAGKQALPDGRQASLPAGGGAPLARLITHRYPLEKAQQAIEEASLPERLKTVLEL